jgi:hypothetical protein
MPLIFGFPEVDDFVLRNQGFGYHVYKQYQRYNMLDIYTVRLNAIKLGYDNLYVLLNNSEIKLINL